jgi:predicted transcriptional regulator of viral defense system
MRFEDLLEVVGDEPLFETGLLLAGDVDTAGVHRQLSRWVRAGRLDQLRRGLYTVAPPFQRVRPHPFLVANRLVPGSYVSLQSALGHYSLIPESVPVTVSVTAGRPGRWDTPLGTYLFRHIQPDFLTGFRRTPLMGGMEALLATPEKALLDLVYLEPDGDSLAYLAELRLQNMDGLDLNELRRLAEAAGKPKLRRAAEQIARLAEIEAEEYEPL